MIQGLKFANVHYLYLLIPVLFIFLILTLKKYVSYDRRLQKGKKKIIFVFTARMIIFILLVISLTQPFLEKRVDSGKVEKLRVLVDKSESMEVLNSNDALREIRKISNEGNISVTLHAFFYAFLLSIGYFFWTGRRRDRRGNGHAG